MRSRRACSLVGLSFVCLVGACGKGEAPAAADGAAATAAGGSSPHPEDTASAGPAGLLDKSPADDWATGNGMVKVLVHRSEARAAAGGMQLVLELDVLDIESGRPISQIDAEAIALTLDGKYVPGTYAVQTSRDAGRGVALALLLPAHLSYALGPDPDQGLEINPLEEVKRGATAIVQKLTDNDRVAVFGLTEEGLRVLAPWGRPSSAVAGVDKLAPLAERRPMAPALYRSIDKVLDSILEGAADLPARRVVLTVSDGVDLNGDKASILDKRINAIAERAASPEVDAEIWALGFTLGEEAPLTSLENLVFKVRGRYRRHTFEAHKDLAKGFEDLGAEVTQGFVVTLTPAAGVRLPAGPIGTLEVAVRLPTSGAIGRGRVHGVTVTP